MQSCGPGALSFVRLTDREFAELVSSEGLQPRQPGRSHGFNVYYKNLHRFSTCFIGGSVAVQAEEVVDCAVGADVVLVGRRHGDGAPLVGLSTAEVVGPAASPMRSAISSSTACPGAAATIRPPSTETTNR